MEFIIFIAVVLTFVVIMGVVHNWSETREKRIDAQIKLLSLKEKMVERGMSPQEIRQVIEAGQEDLDEMLKDLPQPDAERVRLGKEAASAYPDLN